MTEKRLSPLERALALVTEVRPGEGTTALLLALNVLLLLSAYYVIKPVREALILAGSGAEVKSYAAAGQVALLALVVPAYAAFASRTRRAVLIPVVTGVFIGCLALFYLAVRTRLPLVDIVFYLWVGVFNVMIIAQFWSFAADVYTKEQGERLFPIVGIGASVGAVAGSQLTSMLIRPLGVNQLLLVSALVLGISLGITRTIEVLQARQKGPHAIAAESSRHVEAADGQVEAADGQVEAADGQVEAAARQVEAAEASQASTEENGGVADGPEVKEHGSFKLVFRSPYLLLIAALLLLLNLVNTTGEFVLGSVVETSAKDLVEAGRSGGLSVGEYIGEFYADFFFWVNLAGFVIQVGLVSRIIRWVGVRGALLVLPLISLGTYAAIAVVPVLAVVRWTKSAENATDYSLNNTVRNALFLPLARDEKYQAKQVVDSFFVRGGDVLSAALVFVGLHWLNLETAGFAWVNLGLVSLWLVVALRIGRIYARGETRKHFGQ